VLAIAFPGSDRRAEYSKADETDLVLRGYVAFFDPPKETAGPAVAALQQHGISVKILTGDNGAVSRKICRDVGIPDPSVLLGAQVDALSDEELDQPRRTSPSSPGWRSTGRRRGCLSRRCSFLELQPALEAFRGQPMRCSRTNFGLVFAPVRVRRRPLFS
jgi:hypothetical protein